MTRRAPAWAEAETERAPERLSESLRARARDAAASPDVAAKPRDVAASPAAAAAQLTAAIPRRWRCR